MSADSRNLEKECVMKGLTAYLVSIIAGIALSAGAAFAAEEAEITDYLGLPVFEQGIDTAMPPQVGSQDASIFRSAGRGCEDMPGHDDYDGAATINCDRAATEVELDWSYLY
jgi:hypothetical protein